MIRAHGLSVHYGEVHALDDVDLAVQAGKVTALIGMNGAGKSTLFKSFLGLVKPTRGSVLIDGKTPAQARKAGTIAYMPQSEALDWSFPVSVSDVVMMGRYGAQGWTRRVHTNDKTIVSDALDRVELSSYAQRQIGELSGGQRKRVFMARAIAQQARVLLLDEPFAGVDRFSASTIAAVIRDIASEGAAVLLSTHDLDTLQEIADDAVLLMKRVQFHGDVSEAMRPEQLALCFASSVQNLSIAAESKDHRVL